MNFIKHFFILFFLITILPFYSYSVEENRMHSNKIFSKNIKTVLLYNGENQLSYPIMYLNSDEKLTFSFDDLDADIKDYYYTIIHCNSDWTESDLMQSEYIDGFFSYPLIDYEFSFNTIQQYTHYNLIFPEQNLKPTLSGNYILKIFLEGNPDTTILTKQFYILEERVSISAVVKQATLIGERNYKQEIDFSIHHEKLYIANPFSDIKVIVKQNNRDDNSISDLTPLFVRNDHLIYDYETENTFNGHNEFRHFDIKSIRYLSDRIREMDTDSTQTNIYLYSDVSRPFMQYTTIPDLNGEFLIKKQEAWDSETEAEYVNVHFSLLADRKVSYGDIYLIGRFTDWELSEEYKLSFNENSRMYESSVYLKQGYYNYLYALNDTSTGRVDVSYIEGTHYETQNEYYIYVYYREIGKTYDQLIGYIKTTSDSLF
ncbi:MAG: DUF5103 domain-containing protein [Flavobacteriales bacterium]|nr:DUF5103 domain-containing protein [Flavobacteriales bacterium]MBT7481832.1 DUF5103 domain-containing protein [Flavobacteriales bacterium]